MVNSSNAASRDLQRAFGSELDTVNLLYSRRSLNSRFSMESKASTAPTSVATDDLASIKSGQEQEETPSGSSSVAHLRGWLDDFGKDNQSHYVRQQQQQQQQQQRRVNQQQRGHDDDDDDDELQENNKPLRPKVNRRRRASLGAADWVTVSRGSSTTTHHHHPTTTRLSQTPGPAPRRQTSGFCKPKPKLDASQVQATNEGYASVAKLSAWLADDPTRPPKIKPQLRRGANVIAKSRHFEKDLVHVLVEQNNLRTGHVADLKKGWMERTSSSLSNNEDDTTTTTTSPPRCRKAQTDIVTAQDEHDFRCNRAKQLWRSKRNLAERAATSSSSTRTTTTKNVKAESKESLQTAVVVKKTIGVNGKSDDAPAAATTTAVVAKTATSSRENAAATQTCKATRPIHTENAPTQQRQTTHHATTSNDIASPVKVTNCKPKSDATTTPAAEEEEGGFQSARKRIMERASRNPNTNFVNVFSKVQRRKAKFERLEQQNTRRLASAAHGLLKPTWTTATTTAATTASCCVSNGYVKAFVSDIPPKKSLNDLP